MKILIVILFVFGFTGQVFAKQGDQPMGAKQETHRGKKGHTHDGNHKMDAGLKKLDKSQALVKVQGMVCAFCAQGIEKNFKKRPEVSAVDVNLDKMEVLIKFKKGQSLDQKVIKEIVTGAGFQFKGIADAQ